MACRKTIMAAIVTVFLGLTITVDVFSASGGWEGTGSEDTDLNNPSPNYSNLPGTQNCDNFATIDCGGVSWLKYNYVGGESSAMSINFVPRSGSLSKAGDSVGGVGTISGECAKSNVGFYHLGINTQMNLQSDTTMWATGVTVGIPKGLSSDSKEHLGWSSRQNTNNISVVYEGEAFSYWEDYSKFIYQSSTENSWGHRGSFTVSRTKYWGAADYYSMSYKNGSFALTDKVGNFNHQIYAKNSNGKYVKLYQSESYASSESQIKTAYEKYLNYKYGGGNEDVEKSKKDYCTYDSGKKSWKCKNVPSDVYAFCAFGDGDREIQNRTILEYNNEQSVSGYASQTDFNNASSFKDAESGKTKYDGDVIEVTSATVTVTGKFNLKTKDGKGFKSKDVNYKTIISTKDQVSGTVAFNGANMVSASNYGPTTVNLKPNTETTICAAIDSDKKVQSNGSTAANSGTTNSQACMKFLWDPTVSKIQSTTTITAASRTAKSDLDSVAYLDLGTATPDADGYNKGISYGAGKLNIAWSHTLQVTGQQYYSNLQNGEGYLGSTLDSSAINVHAKPGLGSVSSDMNAEGRKRSVTPGNTTNVNGWNPKIFSDPNNPPARYKESGKILETGNVFPGQNLGTITDSIYHDSEVYGDAVSYNGSYEDKSSSASLSGVANYAICNLRSPDGNKTYYIGATGAANDYANLYLNYSGSYTIVGDGNPGNDSATVWVNGKNKDLTLYYEACFGAQIAEDSNGGSGKDVFLLNTSSEELSNLNKNDDPYWTSESAIGSKAISGRTQIRKNENKNIFADEIEDGSIKSRLDNGYVIRPNTSTFKSNILLGKSNFSYIAKTDDVSDTESQRFAITTNVPYNYVLDPQPTNVSDLGVLTIGSPVKFEAKINVSGRINAPVQTEPYSTDTKTTTIKTNIFTLNADEDINSINPEGIFGGQVKTGEGDNYKIFTLSGKDQSATIQDLIGHETVAEDLEKSAILSEGGTNNYSTPEGITVANEIGKKYCMAAAVYPADSHNIGEGNIDIGSDQTAALSGNTVDGALWRVSVSCRTVAKYPSMSVEGSALHVGGEVVTNRTTVGTNVFGSWAEYGIIANNTNMASGATLAYLNSYNASSKNVSGSASVPRNRYDIQSVGNSVVGSQNAGSPEEATIAKNEISQLKTNLARYKTSSCDGMAMTADGKICAKTEDRVFRVYDNKSAIGLETYINGNINGNNDPASDFDTLVITYNGDLTISGDIKKEAPIARKRQIIIFANNIKISNDVKQIDAWLVSDGNIDTCIEKDVGTITIDDCNNELVINGPVIANSLSLDRTYGAEAEGENINGNIRRGEIFNFDPQSIQWAYKESLKDSKTDIQYVKERAVRY